MESQKKKKKMNERKGNTAIKKYTKMIQYEYKGLNKYYTSFAVP